MFEAYFSFFLRVQSGSQGEFRISFQNSGYLQTPQKKEGLPQLFEPPFLTMRLKYVYVCLLSFIFFLFSGYESGLRVHSEWPFVSQGIFRILMSMVFN